jgi:hypothetical protein
VGSSDVGPLTFREGRQSTIGPIGAVWPIVPAATPTTSRAEEPQQQHHHQQQQREQYDHHDHVVFLPCGTLGPR